MTDDEFESARREMVDAQLRSRGIHDRRVLDAMGRVARHRFVPPESASLAYADQALSIAAEQTISQPFIVALMTQALELRGNERVLEIGTGSGYQTAVLAELAGRVFSVERHEKLSTAAASLLEELGYTNIVTVVGDGSLGWAKDAPYDRIVVTAAAEECPPALISQLADGGVLVGPFGDRRSQTLLAIHAKGDNPRRVDLGSCRFVPLIGSQGWPD